MAKFFKANGTLKENINNKFNKKGNKESTQNRKMTISMLGIKSPPNKEKMILKQLTTKVTTGVSYIRNG